MRSFRKYFLSGLAVFLPLLLTVYVSIWALNFTENLFGKYLRTFFLEHYDFYFWGFGILVLLIVVLLCGFLVTHYVGRLLHRQAEKLLLRIPLAGSVYPAFKEITNFIFREQKENFQQVVMVEWPRKDVWMVGFMTNLAPDEMCEKAKKEMVNVLIPTVPNPLTGFVVMIPRQDVVPLDMKVEDAVKIIVSGGVLVPGMPSAVQTDEDQPPQN